MASYLRGLTDAIPQIQPFQPDFDLVQKTLSTLQSRYDQGFAALSNTYNQVLNAPLTDSQNQQARNQFVKHAEDQLKNLSSVDLSLPENLAKAENVFSPFWEDEMILQDANLTKWYNNEIGKALSTRDSQDEKIRSQYSDVAVRYLENGLEKLQNAGRDPGNYSKLEKRRFVPFQNLEAYLNDQAQKIGLKIEWAGTQGPYLINTTNGPMAIPAFETFAHNTLGNNFSEQFRVMGTVEKEERLRAIKQEAPFISDKDALSIMSSDVFGELRTGIQSRKESLITEQNKITNKIGEYEKQPVLNEDQALAYRELLKQADEFKTQFDQTSDELNTLIRDEGKTKQAIIENPDGYFSNVMKQRTVNGWANARAANQQTKIEENPVWKENNLNDYRKAQLDIDRNRLGLEEKKYELDLWKAENNVKNGKNPDGSNINGSQANQDPETAGHYDGLGSTDATSVGNAYQVFTERQQQRWNYAHDRIFNISTGIGSVLTKMGVSDQDAVKYMDMMKEMSIDPEAKFDIKDVLFFKNIGKKLTKETGIGATSGFSQARSALLEGAKKHLTDKMAKGGAGITKDDISMLLSYTSATQALEEYTSLEDQRKQLFTDKISTDRKYKNYIVTRQDGSPDFVGVDEISKLFNKPVYHFKNGAQFTREQLSRYYLEGRLTSGDKDKSNIDIDGVSYLETPDENAKGPFSALRDKYNGRANLDLLNIQKKYGTSKEFYKLRQEVNDKIVPNLQEYQSETGKMGFKVRYDLNDKTRGDVGAKLINEASNPANREGIYIDNSLISEKEDIANAVTSVASMGEDELEKYVSSAFIKTVGINGRPSLELVFKPMKDNDHTTVNGINLSTLAGKKVEIDLNPNASGETLQKIRYNSGYNIYGALTRGKAIDSDPMMAAAGFSFQITPNSTKTPSGVLINIQKKEFKNGNYIKSPLIRDEIPFNLKGPDEIVDFMYNLFQQNLIKNLSAQNVYQQKNNSQLKTPQQIREEYSSGHP